MTNREVCAIAERLARLTGRDAWSLIRAAAQEARSTMPSKVGALLLRAERMFRDGIVLPWLPPPVPSDLPDIPLRRGEEEDWM